MSKNDIEDINAKPVYVMNAAGNPLPVSLTTGSLGSISINAEDIEIGAVEIKNSTDDTRATVGANGLHVDVQASSGVGSLTESAPATDTASSGLNGRLQRIAQRITSLIALIPTSLDVDGFFKVHEQGMANVTGTVNINSISTPPTVTVPTQVIKTVAAIGTPEALAADATYFQSALIGGMKAARTPNVTGVYLGIGSGNDTQPFLINPSEWLSITVPIGQKFDLNDWYLDVLGAGDGVAIIYS